MHDSYIYIYIYIYIQRERERVLDNVCTAGTGTFEYYIKIVPTVYHDLKGSKLHTNQYSVTDHFRKSLVRLTCVLVTYIHTHTYIHIYIP